MIIAINYANKEFSKAQQFNSKSAKKWGADRIISYTQDDMDEAFKTKNDEILKQKKGNGLYLWKPYFLRKAFDEVEENDYLVYTDSGSIFVNKIQHLIDCMEKEKQEIMVFSLENEMLEKKYTKMDAFILMNCLEDFYKNTSQSIGGYVIYKKSESVKVILDEYLEYATDIRIISDNENTQGVENDSSFITHRHDQSIWSLLSKKHNIKRFRDPSQFGCINSYEKEVESRSDYPQIIDSHRKNVANKIELLIIRSKLYKIIEKIKRYLFVR